MNIHEILLKIQTDLKAPKGQTNKFGGYKYRSCEDILEAVKPLLVKYGCTLTLSDTTTEIAGIPVVNATATLTMAEESISVSAQAGVDVNRKGMDISQSFGASGSYAHKYSLNGLFLIDDTKDADTMDNSAVDPKLNRITNCKSMDELQTVWASLTKHDHMTYQAEKEAMKQQLGEK